MLVVSDYDRSSQPGWPVSGGWRRASPADLPDPIRALWRRFSSAEAIWLASVPDREAGGFDGLLAVREAEESQFSVWCGDETPGPVSDGGVVTIADSGRRFRGRRSRSWIALDGNLHVCASLRPRPPVDAAGAGWTLLPVVAAVEAVREVTDGRVSPGIKWVNDLWVEGRKVSGALTATQVRDRRVEQVVFGVGINVRHAPMLSSAPGQVPAGCLAGSVGDGEPSPAAVLFALLRALARGYRTLLDHGPATLLDAYRRDSLVLGRVVRVYAEAEGGQVGSADPAPAPAEGLVESIEPDLSLRLRGRQEVIREGRLVFVESGGT